MMEMMSLLFDYAFEVLPAVVGTVFEATSEVREARKERKEVIDNAKRVIEDSDISEEFKDEIYRMSSGSQTAETFYLGQAKETNDLVKYAIYFMITDDAPLVRNDPSDKKFINGVGILAGYGKIYPNDDIADLDQYDASRVEPGKSPSHLIMKVDLMKVLFNEEFKQKWQAKLGRKACGGNNPRFRIGTNPSVIITGRTARVDEQGFIHPLFFTDEPIKVVPDVNDVTINNEDMMLFENAIAPLFKDSEDKYVYGIDQDKNFILKVYRTNAMNAEDQYILDNGSILGGHRVAILANCLNPFDGTNDTCFVDILKHPDLAKIIVSNRFFSLNREQVNELQKDLLPNTVLYHNIDFSNTGWFDTLSDNDKALLSDSLGLALSLSGMTCDARFRFKEYVAPDKFTLISDNNVISTLSRYGNSTSSNIDDGLTVSLDGKNVNATRREGGTVNAQ